MAARTLEEGRRLAAAALLAAAAALAACQRDDGRTSPGSAGERGPDEVGRAADARPLRSADDEAAAAEDGEWRIPAKDYASTRYSGLDQIDTRSVGSLRLAWTFSTGVLRGHEAAPIVADNTLFVVTPFPNVLYAIDLTRPGGPLKWMYEPRPDPASQGVACCDVVNRGAAYADGRVFINTLDGQTIAVDAETGEEIWRVKLADFNRGESMTMAPLVADGKVFVGNSGGEFGVRGWIAALDAASGEQLWRGYSTGPDDEVLIGDDFQPPYEADRRPNLGVATWPPDQWKLGGGAVWGWISYDPELDLIYHGTSNPGVWNPALRPGDNKWSSSIFARDADTGFARWAYQWTPHDEQDYDGVNENVLVDLPVDGETRRLLLRPERNGFLYVMDRVTGEILSADPYGPVNWASRIDLETGRPVTNPDKATGDRLAQNVCPAAPGMKDWQPSAWSPRTRLLYIPHNNLCMDYEGMEASFIAGTPYVGAAVRMYAGPGGHRGVFKAWDPLARRAVWEIEERFPVWSGALATAGDVVFYGTMDRWFKAVHARTGELLWSFQVSSGIIGQPTTFLGPDGKQYVAVLAGVGGWSGVVVAGMMPEWDPTIALGFPNAMTDLPQYTRLGGELYVFALPDEPGGPGATPPADAAEAEEAGSESPDDVSAGSQPGGDGGEGSR